MNTLLEYGYKARKRPSDHNISNKFSRNNGAAIPPNLIAVTNTESNSSYIRYCEEHNLPVHPTRYPAELPEYFVRMLTDSGDLVIDPFGGSCITVEVAERLQRRWISAEVVEDSLKGAIGRFDKSIILKHAGDPGDNSNYYRMPRPGILWNGTHGEPLPEDGGKKRPIHLTNGQKKASQPEEAEPEIIN